MWTRAGRAILAAALLAAFAAPSRSASASGLSAADFNVFSLGGIRYSSSDFEGRTGAAGDVSLSNFALGGKASGGAATLIAGGSAFLSDGSVYHGGVRACGRVRLSRADVHGEIVSRASCDAAELSSVSRELLDASDRLGALPGDAEPVWNEGLRLTALPGSRRTVYRLTAETLESARAVDLIAARGQTLVVDVSGASASLSNVAVRLTEGPEAGGVVFNFPDARALNLEGVRVPGVVLAPRAATRFESGAVDGRLYVGDLSGDGQVNETGSPALSDALTGLSGAMGIASPASPDIAREAAARVVPLLGIPDFDSPVRSR